MGLASDKSLPLLNGDLEPVDDCQGILKDPGSQPTKQQYKQEIQTFRRGSLSYGSTSTSIAATIPWMRNTLVDSVALSIESLLAVNHDPILMMNTISYTVGTIVVVGGRRSHFPKLLGQVLQEWRLRKQGATLELGFQTSKWKIGLILYTCGAYVQG